MRNRRQQWTKRLIRRFGRNERGAAAVEFALILPFLVTLYLGSIEASSLFTVDRRVEVISGTMADLVARWNPNEGILPKDTLKDYFQAAQGIITPYSTTGLTQVLTVVKVSAAGAATVLWSCGWNGGVAASANSSYSLGTEMMLRSKSGYVVTAMTAYAYKPVLGMVFTSAINLENEAVFLPRFGVEIKEPTAGCPT